MNKKPKLLLIDANALIHRAFHALPPLTLKTGEIINAVFGFCSILLKAINETNPNYIAVAFDTPQPTFRHKEFKEYKATRQKAADELIEQFPKVKEVVKSLNIPIFEKPGYEADDIVGTLSKKANKQNIETIILTGDLDEVQLVSEKTKVYTMRKGFTDTVLYDENMVIEKFGGLTPVQIPDYKALRGDPSDNIPGVPGIGEKTAIELIKKFSSIENLLQEVKKQTEKSQSIKPKLLENIKAYKNQAIISKHLATIVRDIPLEFSPKEAETKNYNRDKALEIFRKYEFKSLLGKLPKSQNHNLKNKITDFDYEIIDSEKKLETLIRKVKKETKEIVIDTETDTLDPINSKLVGASIAYSKNKGYYVPLFKKTFPNTLQKLLMDPAIKKIGHNIKYDLNVLSQYKTKITPVNFDTMIAYYLLHPGDRKFSLNELAFTELSYEKILIEDLIGKGKNQKLMSEVEDKNIAQYACEDAVITYRLYEKIKKQLKEEGLDDLFYSIELPLVSVLAKIEKNGISINTNHLKIMSKQLEKEIIELKNKIYKLAGIEFNISSPQQLKEILFERLDIASDPTVKKNLKKVKSGGFSTAAGTLENLKNKHPIINLIFEYRELVKLKTTYVDALPKLIHPKTKKLHTNFNQTITATGRLSSSNPNLQNIPIRTKIGREVRKAFISQKGFKLVAADYSQIELRIIAHLSNDKKMIESFKKHEDIHTRTAADVNEVPLKEVTYEMRRAAKAVNFGIIYGMSPHGLSQQLGWSREEAQSYIERYYSKYPGIEKYISQTTSFVKKNGYINTVLGRKRYLPEINSSNFQIRSAAERMAINFPAQGMAADLIKIAMIKIDKELPRIIPESKMILQVHDELVFEIPDKEVEKAAKFIEKIMEEVYTLKVPIKVSVYYGNNWKDMTEIIKGDKRKTKGFNH